MYLYLLIFQQGLFKVGISKGDYNIDKSRIRSVTSFFKEYNFIPNESYIITASNHSTLRTLEKQILCDYEDYRIDHSEELKKNGYTEFLKTNCLNDVIEDVTLKINRFPNKNIKIIKGIRIECDESKSRESKYVRIKGNKVLRYNDSINIHRNYFSFVMNNMGKIVEINYDKYIRLYIKIAEIEKNDYNNLNKNYRLPRYISKIVYNNKNKMLEIVFKNTEIYDESDLDILEQYNEIYDLLRVDFLRLDKQYGIKKELNRINKLEEYFETLLNTKGNLFLENIITKVTKRISIDKLAKNLTKVINTGEGYYALDYGKNRRRLIFYDDYSDFASITDRNAWLKDYFKKECEFLKFKTDRDYNFFWYYICKKRIAFSISPDDEGFYPRFRDIVHDNITIDTLSKMVD